MLDYCIRDVNILHRVYLYLEEEKEDWDWSLALKIEYGIATLMASQEQHGVLFDVPKAETLVLKLEEEIQNIEKRALQEIPLRAIMTGNEIQKPFKKDGTYTKQVEEWINSLADPSVV